MNNMWTVISFTFRNKWKSKSFITSSIIFAVLISLVINLPFLIKSFSSDDPLVLGVDATDSQLLTQLDSHFSQLEDTELQIVSMQLTKDRQTLREELVKRFEIGELDGYLYLEQSENEAFPKFVLYTADGFKSSYVSQLYTALGLYKTEQLVNDLGLSQLDLAKLNEPVQLQEETLSLKDGSEQGEGNASEKSPAEYAISLAMVYILVILLFMTLMMYGNMIAMEVTAEKSSRIMEILVSSVTPLRQMFGKVIGVCLLSLAQLAVYVVIALININLPHNAVLLAELDLNLSDLDPWLLVYFILFYLLGYLLYAMLFASIGSLVSRSEDLGQALMPVTFLTLGGFYLAFFGMYTPDATFLKVTSYIPFFTPFVMFLRAGLASPPLWEIWLGIAILLVSTFVMAWLAAKIYRVGVLVYGKRPSMKDVIKMIKN